MRYHFRIFVILALMPMLLKAQDAEMKWQTISRTANGISVLEIDLYRGSVELIPSQGDSIRIQFSAYDYDHYGAENELIPFLSGRGRTRPEVRSTGNQLSIENAVSREIIALRIELPKRLNVIININHLGLVWSSGISGEQEINAFSGQINLSDLSNAALVHIVRDGDIDASYRVLSKDIYSAFSTYDGDINLNILPSSDVAFEATTDLGEISDVFDLDWKLKNPRQFNVKNANGTVQKLTSYHQSAQMGAKGARFLIKNIKGNINIKKRQ